MFFENNFSMDKMKLLFTVCGNVFTILMGGNNGNVQFEKSHTMNQFLNQ